MCISILHLLLLAAAPNEANPPVIVLSDGQVIAATGWSIGQKGALTVVQADSKASRVAPSPMLLDAQTGHPRARSATEARGIVVVQLVNGEVLHGRLKASDSPGTVQLATMDFGPLRLTMDKIASIRIDLGPSRVGTDGDTVDPPYLVVSKYAIVFSVEFAPAPVPLPGRWSTPRGGLSL